MAFHIKNRETEALARKVAAFAQGSRGPQHFECREIEHTLRVRMVAVAGVVARHEEKVADAEKRRAEQVRLDGDAVPVARGDLDDGFQSPLDEETRHRLRLRPVVARSPCV